ncbi:hypothetical protein BBK82_21220 [Lentzea guizhouensis]|uniref:Uncharacterized protein n=1 Tax=Lentzea guizhouensis TaxID=1586287 RepID=A0A1B2HKF7_9PSEU|nr:hypothetical protein [Lentzea guizhouensis]ANZ38209.1 hypothetical protein BBK82_21220 [Lentzea guizhouensis]
MAGAVGIVFGLCVLSFTLGAALMYVVTRRREDASEAPPVPAAAAAPGVSTSDATWVPRPAPVEGVEDDYDSRPIHRNAVMGLPQAEPALAAFAEPVVEPVADPVLDDGQGPALPPPAMPQPVEHTTASERDDFRQRYLRTFEEARRKAGSN